MSSRTLVVAGDRVGSTVKDKWRLEALLGAGGMASVYSAVHRNGRRVAIKVLHPELSASPGIVARFLREGYLANRVGHPNAVAVLDDDRTDDGAVFLVMELLEGHSLERYAQAGGDRLAPADVLRMVDETLAVLAAAHARGIVHRDIKPANLFLTEQGHVKVLDFGIARLAESTGAPRTITGSVIGTPSFMPPEQARGRWELVDGRTDVWAVGATAFALLTGDRPRHGQTVQEELLLAMTQPLPPLASVLPGIAPDLVAVVDRAVAFDRAERWPDAMTMRRALAALWGGATLEACPPSAAAPQPSDGTPRIAPAAVAPLDGPVTTARPSSHTRPTIARYRPARGAHIAIVGVLVAGVALTLGTMRGTRPPPVASFGPAAIPPATIPAADATLTPLAALPATSASPPATGPWVPAAPGPRVMPSAAPSARLVPAVVRRPAGNPYDRRF
jgi:serine/threonine protein kinase